MKTSESESKLAKKAEPVVTDQWAVLDKWWTDEPERVVFIEFVIESETILVKYDTVKKSATATVQDHSAD